MKPDNKQVGANGSKLIADTAVHTDKFFMLIVQEDTVFTSLQTNSVDATGDSDTNVGSEILSQGAIITPRGGLPFNHVKLASGSVIGYRE